MWTARAQPDTAAVIGEVDEPIAAILREEGALSGNPMNIRYAVPARISPVRSDRDAHRDSTLVVGAGIAAAAASLARPLSPLLTSRNRESTHSTRPDNEGWMAEGWAEGELLFAVSRARSVERGSSRRSRRRSRRTGSSSRGTS